ncbi:MAG: UDP-N-acetylmuramate--L-alanine ligase [Nitrospirota bacterium]
MFKKIQRLHFVGIGGSGMSGIAEVLLTLGYRVTGSDLAASEVTRRLESLGGTVYIGHRAEQVEGAQVVVISSAVSPSNVEVAAARARMIPVIPRAEMLAELMRLKYGIAVAGAHGKTTTTSMIATVLAHGGLDPTAVIGGKLNRFGGHAKLGQGEFLVAEADESDGSFLKLSPTIAVVTNIDREHLDHYKEFDEIKRAFLDFVNKVPFYGAAVLCLDEPNLQALIPKIEKRVRTYGRSPQADLTATSIRLSEKGAEFHARLGASDLGRFTLSAPGTHNVSNAMAAILVGLELDLSVDAIREGLAQFSGVERRFQIRGERGGVLVVDDYGHHPTEIRATLAAAKEGWGRRLIVIFQPHRYSRTRDLFADFCTAFYQADVLLVLDVYAAGEPPIEGANSQALVAGIREHGHRDASWVENRAAAVERIAQVAQPGDMVITLGAGDVWKVGPAFLERT